MSQERKVRFLFLLGLCMVVGLMLGLRCVALDSDAYPRLSWSSALLTDEGFYLHNARNRILFGHPQTDQFNNALIMPLLDVLQTAVFRLIGVGVVQTRLISVVFGLLTIGLFFDALRRAFGLRTAVIGGLLLGLDHVMLLYSRLALMDTPGAFVLVAAFWVWVRSGEKGSLTWLRPALCGAVLGSCYGVRGLGAIVFPVPFLIWGWEAWKARRQGDQAAGRLAFRKLLGAAVGLMLALGVYGVAWYLPNRAELTRVNHFYLFVQLIPENLGQLYLFATKSLVGDERGYCSYLFRHTPVQFVCGLLGFAFWGLRRGRVGLRSEPRRNAIYLGLWLLIAWIFFAGVRYSPPRYYLLFYPALTGIAALVLGHIDAVLRTVGSHQLVRTLLGGFLTFHLFEAGLHHRNGTTEYIVYSAVVVVCLYLFLLPTGRGRFRRKPARRLRPAVMAFAVWALLNALWLGDWLTHLTYRQRDADRWLAANLPPQSVLVGDAAPGLCLNNRFVAVCVIAGLCNDNRPLEQFANQPRYVVILDGERNTDWWRYYYPDVIRPEQVKRSFPHLINFSVTVYEVPKEAAQPSAPLRTP